jgi:hypothetical protein
MSWREPSEGESEVSLGMNVGTHSSWRGCPGKGYLGGELGVNFTSVGNVEHVF